MLEIQKDEQIQLAMPKIGDKREKSVADIQESEAFGIITFDQFFKGFELWQRWTLKHLFTAIDYSDLDFEAIDKEIMANERARANEKAGVEGGDEGEGLVDAPIDPPIDPVVILLFKLYFYFALLWFALIFKLVLVHILTSLFKTTSLFIFVFMNNLELCMLLITRKT